MQYFILKFLVPGLLVILVTEIGKRSTTFGALTMSLPVASIIALSWLYAETRDTERVARMTTETLWLVVPSLALFIVLPPLLRRGVNFALAMSIACAVTALCYLGTMALMAAMKAKTG